jgi:UDP-N-acetylglucosamine--N-acetylmuramyl-(pentapeptide) pyrophosphoryl-undecaprenol N-acetylglucosamine transferase
VSDSEKIINRMIITGGGTGGHLFPGIAVAEAVIENFPDSKVLFIGTQRLIDAKVLHGRGFETVALKSRALKGMGLLGILRTIFLLPTSLMAALSIIRNFKPDLVLGVGGYVTGPVILAARLIGIPCCIHEQNSIPGMANKILGKIVNRVFVSLPGSEKHFPPPKTFITGNPVRRELLNAAASPTTNKTGFNLLVLGGSQGAHRVNTLILEAITLYKSELPEQLTIIHQTGTVDEQEVRDTYQNLAVTAEVAPFFSNMEELYRTSDLVISRAGATTLAELMIFHKPAILIPFPYAADNHQEENGRLLVARGGALMFSEAELTGELLGWEILNLATDRERRAEMAEKTGCLAQPNATAAILQHCLELL